MKLTTAATLLAFASPLVEATKNRRPPVSSKKLQKLITEEALVRNLEKLNEIAYANGGNRAFGLPGYDASVDFTYKELFKLKGFKIWKQDFPANFTDTQAAEVTVDDEIFRTVALTYTPSTPEEGVTAELVHGPEGEDACDVANYSGLDVEVKVVLKARLYITALGLYGAEINGERVEDHVLAPGFQSFKHLHVYDATEAVSRGRNAIGILVSQGWYAGRLFGHIEKRDFRNLYGFRIGAMCLLKVTLSYRTNVHIPSDKAWSSSFGPLSDSQIYNGEIYDSGKSPL
ncbi:Bacterial alpha-L-rhamnosidase N-terminal [Fusarium oxysporum f. sp. vasinfectum]|nr:Bacterial alpha-L-rhamnosidase N-terminal [Fusarium oxysporum f. sp. vasinfectum]